MNFSSRAEMIRYIENFRINYKTELCKNFMETGVCEFSKDCAYAHGFDELKSKKDQTHRNYKTKMCKKWHEITPGQCSYGDKCQFIHDEYKVGPLSNTKMQINQFMMPGYPFTFYSDGTSEADKDSLSND